MTATLGTAEVREAVRRMFDRVATAPDADYRFAVGPALARAVGYPAEVLESLPAAASASFTGLAYLHPHLALRGGESVLDLGCGAGLDALLAARAVAPDGTVVGIDLSQAMVARARALAEAVGAVNARFAPGAAEALPLGTGVIDAALANGIFNLCPDKSAVAREVRRVLRPGGRAVVAEVTVEEPVVRPALRTADDWFR